MPRSPLPLLLKLAAAALTGAAALLSFRRLHRCSLLSSLRLDLLASLSNPNPNGAAVRPPSVLVTGFRSQGKSALVNTLCRVLAAEAGPLVLRAETAPAGPTPATVARHVIRAEVAPSEAEYGEEEEERSAVAFVDGTGFGEAADAVTRADVAAEIVGAGGGGGDVAVDCVIVVVRCGTPPKVRRMAVRKLADVAAEVRGRGLHLVVVLTQKKALRSTKQAEELRREVAYRARTDCVYFIENYTARVAINVQHPVPIKNDFDTQFTVLTIVRQCVEFARLYRSRLSRNDTPTSAPAVNLSQKDDPTSAPAVNLSQKDDPTSAPAVNLSQKDDPTSALLVNLSQREGSTSAPVVNLP